MPRKKSKDIIPADPQKSSAAQFLTYIASTDAEVYLGEIHFIFSQDKLPLLGR